MASNSEQLEILGQQMLDTVIQTYNPDNDPSLALALHPGQALADGIVQGGVSNPLRLSEWLEDQYDYPLRLKLSDASKISTSTIGSLPAKSAYLAMIPWAQPGVPADAAEFGRLNALIADARRDLGDNPDALPFNCEPTDFAEADSTAWHVFDRKISTSTTSTTTEVGPGIKLNAQLWKMRAVTSEVVASLPTVSEKVEQRKAWTTQLKSRRVLPGALVSDSALPDAQFAELRHRKAFAVAAAPELQRAHSRRVTLGLRIPAAAVATATATASATPPVPAAPASPAMKHLLDHAALGRLATIQLHELMAAPPVSEVTTSGSELHVHFEYCMLTITRRLAGTRWWHPELLADDRWYVPGMKRGDMVKPATEDGYTYCLPQGLLLVRNVVFSGSWTDEARASMANAASFLGPFLIRPPTAAEINTSTVEQISVYGVGIQVIGELCFPLPALPPMDDPAA